MEYTEGFKARMVQKMLEPAAMSACGLSRETGVPQGTLSRWLRKARIVGAMNGKQMNPIGNGDPAARRPQDWSAEEKLEVVAALLAGVLVVSPIPIRLARSLRFPASLAHLCRSPFFHSTAAAVTPQG